MTYLDVRGRPLTETEWRRLSRDPAYCLLAQCVCGPYQFLLSWLGVVSELEAVPKIFCVQKRRVVLDTVVSPKRSQGDLYEFHEKPAGASLRYEQLIAEEKAKRDE